LIAANQLHVQGKRCISGVIKAFAAAANNEPNWTAAIRAIWKHTAVNCVYRFYFELPKIPLSTDIHWVVAKFLFTKIRRNFIVGNNHSVVITGNGFDINNMIKMSMRDKNIVAF